MTLCGLPLSALSSSVLLGCFFVFLVFFGFVVCESVVCAPASFEELDSARASDDPATDRAKAAMNERIRFEDTGRLLEGLRRRTFDPVDPMLGYYQRHVGSTANHASPGLSIRPARECPVSTRRGRPPRASSRRPS